MRSGLTTLVLRHEPTSVIQLNLLPPCAAKTDLGMLRLKRISYHVTTLVEVAGQPTRRRSDQPVVAMEGSVVGHTRSEGRSTLTRSWRSSVACLVASMLFLDTGWRTAAEHARGIVDRLQYTHVAGEVRRSQDQEARRLTCLRPAQDVIIPERPSNCQF